MIEANLVDYMGSDLSVVNAARVTMGVSREEMKDSDERLIKFLAREKHVTPFRHATVTFRCKAPIAIARQLGKHQVGFSWNEMSRRYKDGAVECFVPDVFFARPENLHSGSGQQVEAESQAHASLLNAFNTMYDSCVKAYEALLEANVAPEQARFILPQGMMTEWVWTGSLYGWFELYRQRSSTHAQYEVRLFAEQVDRVMNDLFPIAWKALKDANIPVVEEKKEVEEVIQTKVCSDCGHEAAVGIAFDRSENSADGYFPICRNCVNMRKTKQESQCQRYYQLT